MKTVLVTKGKPGETFIHYWYQERIASEQNKGKICGLRRCFQVMGRGLQCQWMRY